MARHSFAASLLTTHPGASDPVGICHKVADVTQSVASATVAADIAVLVADGASPTQGHVTTLNTDWTALLAGLPGIPSISDVILSFDATAVGTRSALRRAILRILEAVEGCDALSP